MKKDLDFLKLSDDEQFNLAVDVSRGFLSKALDIIFVKYLKVGKSEK